MLRTGSERGDILPWLLTLKTYVVKFVIQYILPKVLEWAQQTIPILASNAMQDIIDKMRKKGKPMSTVTISVMDAQKTPIVGAKISYLVNSITAADKVTDSTGSAAISGLPDGNYTFNISADGYIGITRTAALTEQAPAIIAVTLAKEVATIVSQAAESVVSNTTITTAAEKAATEVTTAVAAALSTTNVTNIDDAKTAFKAYVPAIKEQVAEIEKAIAAGSIDTVSTMSANLIASTKNQLTESIAWYVKQRAPMICSNGTVPAKYWVPYLEYSSMIGAMYLLRNSITAVVDAALKFIESKIG